MEGMLEEVVNIIEKKLILRRQAVNEISAYNVEKTLQAFRKEQVSDTHFLNSTGYGYDDYGRDTLDRIYARIFGAEAAYVRSQIVSGTHAIAICLFGILRPSDELLYITGDPYDTLHEVIYGTNNGSLQTIGVHCRSIALLNDEFDLQAIEKALTKQTKMIAIQRSCGYAERRSINIAQIAQLITHLKKINSQLIIFVDNCYGEFVEKQEPTDVGADLIAGSLIKNPGGGLVKTGGYIAGRADLLTLCAGRLTAPGIGAHVGATLGNLVDMYQGLFMAPHIVAEALQGALFTAALFAHFGFNVAPSWDEQRTDIVQKIVFKHKKKLIKFCQMIQAWSPVNAHVTPFPAIIPGYEDEVIMGAGTFIQGASIELSADGCLRPPYTAFLQGGLSYEHVKLAVVKALTAILNYSD